MTAQRPDILLHRGQELALFALPLDSYLERLRKSQCPNFHWSSTACYRGYVARWEIKDGGLYLIDLDGFVEAGDGTVSEVDLAAALPRLAPPARATWLTDELRCPEGRLLQYVHHPFASTYERDRLFQIKDGAVLREEVRLNLPEPIYYEVTADGSRIPMGDCDPGLASRITDPSIPDDEILGHPTEGAPPEGEPAGGYFVAAECVRGLPGDRLVVLDRTNRPDDD